MPRSATDPDRLTGVIGMLALGDRRERAVVLRYREEMRYDVRRIQARMLRSALLLAVRNDDELLAQAVLDSGVSIRESFPRYAHYLHQTVSENKIRVLRLLVDREIVAGPFANRLLITASGAGALKAMRVLFDARGIDVNFRHCGAFALLEASSKGHVGAIKLLLSRREINANQRARKYPLGSAIETPALGTAITKQHLAATKTLVQSRKVVCDYVDSDEHGPIHLAILEAKREPRQNGTQGNLTPTAGVRILQYLLRSKRVKKHLPGTVPLIAFGAWVDGQGHLVYELLACRELDPNEPDDEGNTALHYCVRYGNLRYARALVADGRINPEIRNREGERACDLASGGPVVELLLGE